MRDKEKFSFDINVFLIGIKILLNYLALHLHLNCVSMMKSRSFQAMLSLYGKELIVYKAMIIILILIENFYSSSSLFC